DATAGSSPRMPEGVKPLCGYVHPDDVKKWMMYDLMPGSGVNVHQENYNVALSKTRQDHSELVGAIIAEPPKPYQRSLDRSIVHAILGFCQHHTHELANDIRRTMQQKIGYAKFYFVKKTLDPDSPKTTPASISVEASPRRMSMEMARRGAIGLPLEFSLKVHTGEFKRRRVSGTFSRGLSERDDVTAHLPPRQMPDLSSSNYSEITNDLPNRLSDEFERQTMSISADILSDRLPADEANRLALSMLAKKISAELGSQISCDFSGQISADSSSRLPDDLSTRSIAGLSDRSTDLSSNRMPAERVVSTTLDILSGRTPETSLSELANRIGSVPGGVSSGFLDMLNNIYPSR
ncbi:unnamed protein product, partial [Candidula unifasciata]